MNPWTALLVGLLLGWLIEYAIDWLFWRRRSTDEQIVADLQEQLKASEERAAGLEAQLAALGVGAAAGVAATASEGEAADEGGILLEDKAAEGPAAEPADDQPLSVEEDFYGDMETGTTGERFDEGSELEALAVGAEEADESHDSVEETGTADGDGDYAAAERPDDEGTAVNGDDATDEGVEPEEAEESTASESPAVADEVDEPVLATAESDGDNEELEDVDKMDTNLEPEENEPPLEEDGDISGSDASELTGEDTSMRQDTGAFNEDAFMSGEGGQGS